GWHGVLAPVTMKNHWKASMSGGMAGLQTQLGVSDTPRQVRLLLLSAKARDRHEHDRHIAGIAPFDILITWWRLWLQDCPRRAVRFAQEHARGASRTPVAGGARIF